MSIERTQRDAVTACALTWLKTPYHHHARVKGAGVDCAQLLIAVYSGCGLIPAIDVGFYNHDWHMHRSEEKYLGWVNRYARPVETPLPGDVVLYRFGRCISHGAIVIEWPRIVHAYIGKGCILDEGDSGMLADRLAGFWSVWPRRGAVPAPDQGGAR